MPLPVAREELALEAPDVHADRALRFTRAAFEAEVQHVVDVAIAERRFAEPSGHRQTQRVRPAARRMFFVARRHVRRTHRAIQRLAADAEAAAHLDRAAHPVVFTEVEMRRRIRRDVRDAVAQVRRKRRTIDDLAGIEGAAGIERLLDGPERLVEHRAEHLLGERPADHAVAVLGRKRSAELEHEIRNVVGDGFETGDAFGGLEIDDGPHVQTPNRRVRVDAGRAAVAPDDREEALDVIAKLLRRDGSVFDERERLGVALHRHREAERRLAEAPDARLIGGARRAPPRAADARAGEGALQRFKSRRQILRAVGVELDAEKRASISLKDAPSQRVERGALPRVVEDELVHHLNGRWAVAQDKRCGAQGVEQLFELDRENGLGIRQRDEIDFRLDDEAERALRADHQLGQVERLRRIDEFVEVVAAHAAQDLREAPIDLRRALSCYPAHGAIARGLQRLTRGRGRNLRVRQRTEMHDRPVGEDDVLLQHVVDRLAVQDRAGAARVVRHHAADGRAARGRDVGREAQAMRAQLRVQGVEHDTGLDARPAFGDVYFEDAIEVLRRVELQSGADRLSRLRRPAAARSDRHAMPPGDCDRADDIISCARHDDAERCDLIDARVGRVERAGDGVESDFARDPIFEFALKSRQGHHIIPGA